MPLSHAHVCAREIANDEYHRLRELDLLNPDLKPRPHGELIAIPVKAGDLELDFEAIERHNPHFELESMLENPPKKWEKLGDMVIFKQGTDTSMWRLEKVAESLGATRIAIQNEIEPGPKRESSLELILGKDGWVIHKENFVEYEFDATKVMFSSGNVTERRRMGEIQTKDEIIVDAFCGIGYYTLQFLVRGLANHVHACEINPNSIIALQKGLKRNDVSERCTIHEGDNKVTMKSLRGVADRVILGLIPSSMNAWGNAIRCLKPEGGVLHIHMNVHEDEIEAWSGKTADWFATASGKTAEILHLEVVKQYSPRIMHVVLDLKLA